MFAFTSLLNSYVMLVLDIQRLLKLRDIRHGRSYLINHGYTDNEARLLLSGKMEMVRLRTFTRLNATFDCTVHECLDWRGPSDHPMAYLSKSGVVEISQLLDGLSPKELEAIFTMLQEMRRQRGVGQ